MAKKVKKVKKNKYSTGKDQPNNLKNITLFYAQAELDYHELGLLTAYDIEKILSEFLEDSYIQGLKNVLVITGKGQTVKPLVSKLLPKNKYVESFKIAGYFNGQEGAIEVTLVDRL